MLLCLDIRLLVSSRLSRVASHQSLGCLLASSLQEGFDAQIIDVVCSQTNVGQWVQSSICGEAGIIAVPSPTMTHDGYRRVAFQDMSLSINYVLMSFRPKHKVKKKKKKQTNKTKTNPIISCLLVRWQEKAENHQQKDHHHSTQAK